MVFEPFRCMLSGFVVSILILSTFSLVYQVFVFVIFVFSSSKSLPTPETVKLQTPLSLDLLRVEFLITPLLCPQIQTLKPKWDIIFFLIRQIKMTGLIPPKDDKRMKEWTSSQTGLGRQQVSSSFPADIWQELYKFKTHISFDPIIPLVGICPCSSKSPQKHPATWGLWRHWLWMQKIKNKYV